jgi:hypothetical protein
MKRDLKKNKRSDALFGEEALAFAMNHTKLYKDEDATSLAATYTEFGYCLLESDCWDAYYIAKLRIDDKNNEIVFDSIKTDLITLNMSEGQSFADVCRGGGWNKGPFSVDIIDLKTKKPKTIFIDTYMMAFDSLEDLRLYDKFSSSVYKKDSKFEELEKLTPYFQDENFVLAAREDVRSNIYDTEFEAGYFEGKRLMKNANKAIDNAVERANAMSK